MINLILALHAEAKPILNCFRLKKDVASRAFEIFSNSDRSINLIVAGIGKINTAATVSYLHQYSQANSATAYLNLGIAGSCHFSVGTIVAAEKITDVVMLKNYYPAVYLAKQIVHTTVNTFDRPQLQYPEVGVIDMEASAFIQVAMRFVNLEFIQCAKIISDCNSNDLQQLTAGRVEQLIASQLPLIKILVDYLMNLSLTESNAINNTIENVNPEQFQKMWHFTHNELFQLQQLLRRWKILESGDAFTFCQDAKVAREVIFKLKNHLQQSNFY